MVPFSVKVCRAPGTRQAVAHKGGGVHGNGPRGALTDRQDVQNVLVLNPALPQGDLPADQGDHGIAAPKGKRPDLQKFQKQL